MSDHVCPGLLAGPTRQVTFIDPPLVAVEGRFFSGDLYCSVLSSSSSCGLPGCLGPSPPQSMLLILAAALRGPQGQKSGQLLVLAGRPLWGDGLLLWVCSRVQEQTEQMVTQVCEMGRPLLGPVAREGPNA